MNQVGPTKCNEHVVSSADWNLEPLPLPSWLADFDPDRLQESEKAQSEVLRQKQIEPSQIPHENEKDHIAKLITELKPCTTLRDIRKLFVSLEVNVQDQPLVSRMAFQRLLDRRSSIRALFTFLEDAFLNTPQAGNFWLFLSDQRRFKSIQSREYLQQWTYDQAALGMFTPEDVTSIMRFAVSPENARRWFLLAVKVWEGVQKSSVLTSRDLQPEALTMLLECLSNPLIPGKHRKIGLEVILMLEPSQLDDIGSEISRFFESWMWPSTPSEDSQHATEDRNDQFSPSTKFVRAISRLRIDLACSCVANMSRRFVERCQKSNAENSNYRDALNKWWAMIFQSGSFSSIYSSLQWQKLEDYLVKDSGEIIRPYLLSLSTEQLCRFYMRRKLHMPQSAIDQASIPATPIEDSQTLSRISETASPIIALVETLKNNIRSTKKPLLGLFTFLRELGAFPAIVEIVEEAGLIINRWMLIAEITELAKVNIKIAYRVFRACPWLPLESCPDLAVGLLSTPYWGHPQNLFHLRRAHWRTCNQMAFFGPNPYAAIIAQNTFYHRVALAIAQCPRVSPRSAYVWVYHCYLTVKWRKRLGSIGPEMTRALTHAGIIRQLQAEKWVSTEQVRWILSKVQEVEGEAAAQQLNELVYEWRGEVIHKNAERVRQKKLLEARISPWRYQ